MPSMPNAPILRAGPGICPTGVFREPIRGHPDLAPGVRRTPERGIRVWRPGQAPEQEAIFRLDHETGKGLSDVALMSSP